MTPMTNAGNGIRLLAELIAEKTGGNPEHLTNFHAPLLALLLKAKRFEDALPYLKVNPLLLFDEKFEPVKKSGTRGEATTALNKTFRGGAFMQTFLSVLGKSIPENSALFGSSKPGGGKSEAGLLIPKSVLLYFYYGSMVYSAMERYEDALAFLEVMFSLPAIRLSAIVIMGAKKYVLYSLIVGRQDPLIAFNAAMYSCGSALSRQVISSIALYTQLVTNVQKSVESQLSEANMVALHLQHNIDKYANDDNIGLMKRLINVCKERSVKRLPKIFLTLPRDDLSRRTHMPQEEAENIMLRLRNRGEMKVRFDDALQVFYFEESPMPASVDARLCYAELESALERMNQASDLIKEYDHAVSKNAVYQERSRKRVGSAITEDNEGDNEAEAFGDGIDFDA